MADTKTSNSLQSSQTIAKKKLEEFEILHEDDEFEEFEADWLAHSEEEDNLWETDWDDEDINDEFAKQLRAELDKSSREQLS